MNGMLSQHSDGICGAYSIINAINALGDTADYETIAKLSGTTTRHGTSQRGILRCLDGLGYRSAPYFTRNAENAWRWLHRNATNSPIILLIDNYEHYATVTGTMNGSVVLVDPSWSKKQKNVFVLSKQDALMKWGYLGRYWAVQVSK